MQGMNPRQPRPSKCPRRGCSGFSKAIPNTTTPKVTWQDPAQSILNTQPLILDAAEHALILEAGSYQHVIYDQYGNLVWDPITEGTSGELIGNMADNVYVAGSGFTPDTTTQLTSSSMPGSTANMWAYFDTGPRAADRRLRS
ncbi:hypothetical protein KQH49_10905 [Mycetohabitans sp. B5]|nr:MULTISPECIES: hypothetical protein [Mycetohabitans]MCG1055415.1 hypothetical protein [Mycetohabitans sp. B5]